MPTKSEPIDYTLNYDPRCWGHANLAWRQWSASEFRHYYPQAAFHHAVANKDFPKFGLRKGDTIVVKYNEERTRVGFIGSNGMTQREVTRLRKMLMADSFTLYIPAKGRQHTIEMKNRRLKNQRHFTFATHHPARGADDARQPEGFTIIRSNVPMAKTAAVKV